MRVISISILLLIMLPAILAGNFGEVRDLIDQGKLHQAEEQLGRELTGTFSDWEGAYLSGILKANGELSVSELEKGLLLCKDNCEEIISRLCAAYYSSGNFQKVVDFYEENDDKLDDDTKSFHAFWFASLAYLKLGDFDKAEDIIKKTDGAEKGFAIWSEILRANYQYLKEDKKDARKRLNEVITAGGPSGFSALYARTYQYALDGNMDKAYSGFTMLKEAHDEFIGSDELLIMLQGDQQSSSSDGTAERIAGVRYTIQIGTYADKAEMQKVRDDLGEDGWSTFLMSKFVGGKKYWILTVGSFDTVEGAQGSKEILEGALDTSLKVIILE